MVYSQKRNKTAFIALRPLNKEGKGFIVHIHIINVEIYLIFVIIIYLPVLITLNFTNGSLKQIDSIRIFVLTNIIRLSWNFSVYLYI